MAEDRSNTVMITAMLAGIGKVPPTAADELCYASRLSNQLLLLVARNWNQCTALDAVLANEGTPLDVRFMTCGDTDSARDGGGTIVSTIHIRSNIERQNLTLVGRLNGKAIGRIEIPQTDLKTTLRRTLTALDAAERERVGKFIAAVPSAHRLTTDDLALSKSLYMVREALRERLPTVMITPEEPCAAHIDTVIRTDSRGFYVQGWMHDAEAPIRRVTAVSPEGERVELLERMFWYARPDVRQIYADTGQVHNQRQGFIAFFELETPSLLRDGWLIEIENEAGTEGETRTPAVMNDAAAARMKLLGNLPLDALPNETLMASHVHPAIIRLRERHAKGFKVTEVINYGTPSESPEVSVVIPLYGRVDFLEHQLAQFVLDPEMRSVDLVYVLDSPELERMLRDYAAQLFRLYRVPFRVATLQQNSGFAAANNAGVAQARGSLLLLLNSDVLPDKPGWLSAMTDFYRSTENVGALGVKLLYPDESLQHAGMFFDLPSDTALAGMWRNVHYFKGFPRDLPAANVPRRVPAVTGAALMIDKDLYKRVGGFPDLYLQGDHEDSDICLRLIEEGLDNWYFPGVELYHLEGQSYPSAARGAMALYNRWLHTKRWDERIREVMARYPSSIEETIDWSTASGLLQ
jgi:GT2 family glycosyltransferase